MNAKNQNQQPQQSNKPRPAVSSGGATATTEPATETALAANGLAGARMPLQPEASIAEGAIDHAQPAPPRASALEADLVPDGATSDDVEQGGAPHDDPAPEPGSAEGRPANFVRRPFGGVLPKLGGGQRPGYRRYWFNDKPGRIARAKEAGYTHVIEEGKPVRRTVTGGGLLAYLMEIPIQWFKNDMKAQEEQVNEIDRAIRSGNLKRTDGDQRYVPQNAIKFETE
jgi:hypothetical protein